MTKTKAYVYINGFDVSEVWQNISLLNLIIIVHIQLICQWVGDTWRSDKGLYNSWIMYLFHKINFLAFISAKSLILSNSR